MPKRVLPLTDLKIRNAKVNKSGKTSRLSDGDGLYVLIKPDGAKLWRFDYTRPSGQRNTLSFGTYPEVSLDAAREERLVARRQLRNKIDPGVIRKTNRAETFEPIAYEWIKNQSAKWSDSHTNTTLKRLKGNIFPWLGTRPVKEITSSEVLSVLRRIEQRGAIETAHRCKSICSQVFRYAISTDRAETDPVAGLKDALQAVVPKPHPAILDPIVIGRLLREIENYKGHFITKCALRLAPLVFQRPGELRFARWAEIDFKSGTWIIPVERMKLKKSQKIARAGESHIVPLSNQALAVLNEIHPLTGEGSLVFPSVRIAPNSKGSSAKPLSENTLNAALRNMGFDKNTMTTHGWRSIARSLLDEILGHKPTAIERQLFHAVADPLGESYNRAQHFDERRKMMQRWADYLDSLKAGAKVVPLHHESKKHNI